MFERATIAHPGLVGGKVDVGRILETLLYYNHVDALIDGRVFPGLWEQLGPTGTADLLSCPTLSAQITAQMPAIINNSRHGIKTHAPTFIAAAGREKEGQFDPVKEVARSLHQMISNRQSTELSRVRQILSGRAMTSYDKILANVPTKGNLFESLIRDSSSMQVFLEAYASANGLAINKEALHALRVEVLKTAEGFLISNNIDLNRIVAREPPLTGWDEVLPLVQDYSFDLHLSQARSADVITNEANSYIASKRIDMSIARATKAEEERSAFEEFAFNEARPFREAFNSGQLSLADALKVIDQTAKFREWLNGLPPGTEVVTEYLRAVNRDTVLGKLPGKVTRFAVFTGGGVALDLIATGGIGTAVGLGLSAFDSFILEGLLKGWRPNHFVAQVQKALPKRDNN